MSRTGCWAEILFADLADSCANSVHNKNNLSPLFWRVEWSNRSESFFYRKDMILRYTLTIFVLRISIFWRSHRGAFSVIPQATWEISEVQKSNKSDRWGNYLFAKQKMSRHRYLSYFRDKKDFRSIASLSSSKKWSKVIFDCHKVVNRICIEIYFGEQNLHRKCSNLLKFHFRSNITVSTQFYSINMKNRHCLSIPEQ